MKKMFIASVAVFLLLGCTQKNLDISDVEKELQAEDKTVIYDIKMQDISQTLEASISKFSKFPFISEAVRSDFKGHYSPEFYAKHSVSLHAQRMDRVDYWSLQKDFKSLDVIYTKAIWINQYKQVSNDVFVNLSYAHKLSTKEQKVLRDWIAQGGVLWIENGLYATGNELSVPALKSENLKFLNFQVSPCTYDNTKEFVFTDMKSIAQLHPLKSLELLVTKRKQIHYILKGKVLVSSSKNPLVSLNEYGKGKIFSLLPFEYTSLYRDGEFLRWKLLEIIKNNTKVVGLQAEKPIKKEVLKVEKKDTKEIQKDETLKTSPQEAYCIQLFSTYVYKDAKKEMLYYKNFPLSRIEKRKKQYVGRVGMYEHFKEGLGDLEKLQKIYPNAFMRRCHYSK